MTLFSDPQIFQYHYSSYIVMVTSKNVSIYRKVLTIPTLTPLSHQEQSQRPSPSPQHPLFIKLSEGIQVDGAPITPYRQCSYET